MKISAVVLAHNEAVTLAHSLKRLNWCDEVVVVDDNSTDRTVEIAKKLGARVFQRALENNFSAQRNFGLKKARGDWVLFVDADEVVTKELADEIRERVREKKDGFWIKRRETWYGKELQHGEWGKTKFVRLARHEAGKWERGVHETWKVKGEVGLLKQSLIHGDASLSERLEKINFYSRLHAEELEKERKSVGFWRVLVMPVAKFGVNYFVKGGYRDGGHGFVLAIIMSLHSFMAWSDLWLRKP